MMNMSDPKFKKIISTVIVVVLVLAMIVPMALSKMAHVEAMADGTLVLFDYRNRDPLTYNARACVIDMDDNG